MTNATHTKSISTQIEISDPIMNELISPNATLVQLDNSAQHTEGPVYLPTEDSVVWSDIIGDRLLQYKAGEVSVFKSPARYQNGNALDLEGRIVGCSHRDRAIVRQAHSGEWTVLVDSYEGKRLNSPNDIVVKSDGTLWFTDPSFGLTTPSEGCGGQQEQFGSFVFRFDPNTQEIDAVIKEMDRPNGLAFSPDEQRLYVSDTSAVANSSLLNHILVYDIVEERLAKNGKVFAIVEPGEPDGFCLDEKGHVFTSAEDGIHIYTPSGLLLGKIKVPEVCANLTFGGKERDRLFITAGDSLYSIQLKTRGIHQPTGTT
ncbi:MAG: SMP-30/gluconolactonase/LRE family protein [Cyanobacteria bacterium J06650_10]